MIKFNFQVLLVKIRNCIRQKNVKKLNTFKFQVILRMKLWPNIKNHLIKI